jgi:hypothetical protein
MVSFNSYAKLHEGKYKVSIPQLIWTPHHTAMGEKKTELPLKHPRLVTVSERTPFFCDICLEFRDSLEYVTQNQNRLDGKLIRSRLWLNSKPKLKL